MNVAVTGAAFAVLLLLWRRLAPRLRSLNLAAQRWSRGEWDYRARAGGTDELDQLAATFNVMATAIQQREGELRIAARLLEARVAERTDALQTANGRLQQELA
jgi:nitrate/nitrite-specific signal transduction histidine kinase